MLILLKIYVFLTNLYYFLVKINQKIIYLHLKKKM
jgi:hypothetical protein